MANKEGIETTISGVRYVSADVFVNKYIGGNKIFEGYVIGFGYVKVINIAIQPPHLNGFSPEVRNIPYEESHFEIDSKMEADRSLAAVKQSLRGLFINGKTSITVESGMTLSGIASLFNVTVDDLVRWNNIENPDKISVGQRVTIVNNSYLPMENMYSNSTNIDSNNESSEYSFLYSKEMGLLAMGLTIASTALSAYQEIPEYNRMATSLSTDRFLIRYNGNIRNWSSKFHGNGAVSKGVVQAGKAEYLQHLNKLKWAKWGGHITGSIGVILSVSQCYNATNPEQQAVSMLDTAMGCVGFIPVGGWIASGAYGISAPLRELWNQKVLPVQIETGIEGCASVMPFK